MSSAILVEFYRHNTWANLRLLAACAALTDEQLDVVLPGTYGSIRSTLVHLIGAEERYLRLLGHTADDLLTHGAAYPGLADLERRVRRSGALLAEVAATAEAATILTGVRNGEAYTLPLPIALLQVINHATEHRAHINTILTQLGVAAPGLDGWHYHEAGGAS